MAIPRHYDFITGKEAGDDFDWNAWSQTQQEWWPTPEGMGSRYNVPLFQSTKGGGWSWYRDAALERRRESDYLAANPWAALTQEGGIYTPEGTDTREFQDKLRSYRALYPGSDPGPEVQSWEDLVKWSAQTKTDVGWENDYLPQSDYLWNQHWDQTYQRQMNTFAESQFKSNFEAYQGTTEGRVEEEEREREEIGEQTPITTTPPPQQDTGGQPGTGPGLTPEPAEDFTQETPPSDLQERRRRARRRGTTRTAYYLADASLSRPTLLGE